MGCGVYGVSGERGIRWRERVLEAKSVFHFESYKICALVCVSLLGSYFPDYDFRISNFL
jgi:hypothetical protein